MAAKKDWTVKECLDWTADYLGSRGIERPRLSAEWLLSAATGLTRVGIYTNFDTPLTADELSFMHQAVARRAKGEPLQYISGETSFRTIDVACEPGVLIPRPETEVLVEEVLSYLDQEILGADARDQRVRVELPWNDEVEAARRAEAEAAARQTADDADDLQQDGPDEGTFGHIEPDELNDEPEEAAGPVLDDASDEDEAALSAVDDDLAPEPEPRCARVLEVGCGTGCISLSIAAERAGRATCIATDIEPRAVALATKNRESLGIDPQVVDIRLGNLVSPLDRESEWGTFDVLVSNPPYIPTKVMGELPHEVADFEPHLALDGGSDGLDIFRRLLNAAPYMLREGGLFICELFEESCDPAAQLCREAGLGDVRVVKDLTGRPRIVAARVLEARARD
uniref:N5-glutamine methyltransferase family protein n=1 Tax=Collinsella bouchesdurhonensis TaxID=1907654 RepID=UPI00359C2BAF